MDIQVVNIKQTKCHPSLSHNGTGVYSFPTVSRHDLVVSEEMEARVDVGTYMQIIEPPLRRAVQVLSTFCSSWSVRTTATQTQIQTDDMTKFHPVIFFTALKLKVDGLRRLQVCM